MKKIDLVTFFDNVGYDWKKDAELIKQICYLTKSRVNHSKVEFEFGHGMEQPFLVKAVAEWQKSDTFFEMGTGRGTACYSVSLLNSVERIDTIDIVPFDFRRNEAIGYEQAFVSNKDLYEMIPFVEKSKINFHQRTDLGRMLSSPNDGYDLFFVDGNHSDAGIISEDFIICKSFSRDNSIVIWDDYDPEKYAVRGVIESVLEKNPDYDALLVESRGHLFGEKSPERNAGMVLMKKGNFDEDIFAKSQ